MSQNNEIPVMEKKSSNDALSIATKFIKKAAIFITIYLFGYMGWSSAWIILFAIISTIRKEFIRDNKKKWNIARAAALGYEEKIVLAELQNLPSWVQFPDVERVEWLNRIIKQIWPHVNHYVRDLVSKLIEPKMKSYLNKSFKSEKVILGRVPFRVDGIKVYDKGVSRNIIVMDLDISYASDCHITFSVSGMTGGIENFQLCGRLRVIMRPLISSLPLIGGLQIYFMKNPEIDFDLVGVAQVLSIPGLRNILYKAVLETITSILVFPNVFSIKLSDEVDSSELKILEPEGVLRVHVAEAKHLMKKDINLLGKGKSDPYAVISVGSQQLKTQVIDNTINPKWDYWCEFILEANSELNIHVWDQDEGTKDETLGSVKIDVYNVVSKGQNDLWLPLEGVMHGMIRVRLTWFKLSADYNDLKTVLEETQLLKVKTMNTALLILYVDSIKNLPQIKATTAPDPYVILQLGKQKYETETVKNTTEPIYENGFIFFVYNPETDAITIKIIDKQTNLEIGELVYNIYNLSNKPNLEINNQQLALAKSGPQTTILCSFKLRILKRELQEEDETQNELLESNGGTEKPPPLEKRESSISFNSIKNSEVTVVQESSNSDEVPDANSKLIQRIPSITSSSGEFGLGRIKLTLRYSIQRQKLIVVIHQIANIPLKYSTSIPDPYVKLYLLPAKHKNTKRKTQVVRDNCNPVYDETFEYTLSEYDMNNLQLEVTVASEKKKFGIGNKTLGQVIVDFSKYNLIQSCVEWFDLQPKADKD